MKKKKDNVYRVKLSQNGKSITLPAWAESIELPKDAKTGFTIEIDSYSCIKKIILVNPSQTIETLEDK